MPQAVATAYRVAVDLEARRDALAGDLASIESTIPDAPPEPDREADAQQFVQALLDDSRDGTSEHTDALTREQAAADARYADAVAKFDAAVRKISARADPLRARLRALEAAAAQANADLDAAIRATAGDYHAVAVARHADIVVTLLNSWIDANVLQYLATDGRAPLARALELPLHALPDDFSPPPGFYVDRAALVIQFNRDYELIRARMGAILDAWKRPEVAEGGGDD